MDVIKIARSCIRLANSFPEFGKALLMGSIHCQFGDVSHHELDSDQKNRLLHALIEAWWLGSETKLWNENPTLSGTPIEWLNIEQFTDDGERVLDPYGNTAITMYDSLYPGFYLSAIKDEFGVGEFEVTSDVLYFALADCGILSAYPSSDGRTVIGSKLGVNFKDILPNGFKVGRWSKVVKSNAFSKSAEMACKIAGVTSDDVLHMYMMGNAPVIDAMVSGNNIAYVPQTSASTLFEGIVSVLEKAPFASLNVSDLYMIVKDGKLVCGKLVVQKKANGEAVVTTY